jgi:hypothetical protein
MTLVSVGEEVVRNNITLQHPFAHHLLSNVTYTPSYVRYCH